jgi:hypothetical protein
VGHRLKNIIFFPSRSQVSLRPVMVDAEHEMSTAIYVIVGCKHSGVSKLKIYFFPVAINRDRDSSVGTATCYGLDDPGIEFRCRRDFPHPSNTGPAAHPTSYTVDTGSFLRVKWPVRGVDHPPPTSAEVKERVGIYLYSHSEPSWPVLR